MILVLGALADGAIAYLVHRLTERHARFLLLDPRLHGDGFHLDWEMDDGKIGGQLRHDGATTPFADVRSVYVHHVHLARQERTQPVATERLPDMESHWLLHTFLETIPALVCNRPSASATNLSKTYQQQIIAAHGFLVPRTLSSNLPEEARAFYEQCHRRVIYKSLSARRSIVKRLTESDLDRLDDVRTCPTQFQEWVPGVDIRVHVVGNRVFPTEIVTEATDYRYSGRDGLPRSMRAAELPGGIEGRCIELVKSLGMVTGGVDLRRNLEGGYYCFEVNPTPAFMFYQQYTGQRIGDALVDVLETGA